MPPWYFRILRVTKYLAPQIAAGSSAHGPASNGRSPGGATGGRQVKRPVSWLAEPPHGFLRVLLGTPRYLYRAHLGWLLGHRFLLLTHLGRKSRLVRQTPIEVVRYDPLTREATVGAAWGERTDWYRNLRAGGALRVEIGRERFLPRVRFLDEAEMRSVLADYFRRNRWAGRWAGPRLFGERLDREEGQRAFAMVLRGVAFSPTRGDESGEDLPQDDGASVGSR